MNKNQELELLKIGYRLKELRIKKGYSNQEFFAYDFKLGRNQYQKLESGKANPTIKSLLKVLAIHDLSLEDFFAIDPKTPE